MELLKKILSSSLWLLIGNSIGRLAMFLANIFAARMLSQEAFGQFAMIRNTISSIEGLISGTFGSTIIKEVAQANHKEKENLPYILSTIFILNIVIAFVISIFIFFYANFIVEKFLLNNTNLINALYIGIFILLSTTFSSLIQNILIGFEEFKKLATLSIITSIVSIPTIFMLIYFFKLYGALLGITFYFAFDFCMKYIYYKKINIHTIFQYSQLKKYTKNILLISAPLFLSMLINLFSFWYLRILVVNESNGFKEIAIFDAAYQWLTVIMIITGATTNVALSMLSKINNNHSKIFYINLLINFLISFFFALFFIIFSKEIMSIYGENYKDGYFVLSILSVTSIFFTLSAVYNKYFISIGKTKYILLSIFLSSLSMFIFYKFQFSTDIIQNLSYSFLLFYIINFITYLLLKFINKENKC
jgi:O-antigen/teichoic acid export membrane protein